MGGFQQLYRFTQNFVEKIFGDYIIDCIKDLHVEMKKLYMKQASNRFDVKRLYQIHYCD